MNKRQRKKQLNNFVDAFTMELIKNNPEVYFFMSKKRKRMYRRCLAKL